MSFKLKPKIIINNVNSTIEGSIPNSIKKTLTAFVAGYKFTPQYKYKKWDGKLCVLQDTVFPTGLLQTVVEAYAKEKVQVELIDNRTIKSVQLKSTTVNLRDYQIEAINKAVSNTLYNSWWPRGFIGSATGSGKTTIAAALLETVNVPSLFIADRIDLIVQAQDRFKSFGISSGQISSKVKDFNKQITVSTVQTLLNFKKNFDKKKFYIGILKRFEIDPPLALTDGKPDWEIRLKRSIDRPTYDGLIDAWNDKVQKSELDGAKIKQFLSKIEMVIVDEAHLISGRAEGASMFAEALALMPNAYMRYGLTATPEMNGDYSNLVAQGAIGRVIYSIGTQTLVDKGFLAPTNVIMYNMPKDESIPKKWPDCYDLGIVSYAPRNEKIIAQAVSRASPVLILVSRVEHGRLLQTMLKSQKVDAPFISGVEDVDTRRAAVADLKNGTVKVCIASTVWNQGIDIPNLKTVILAGGGKSIIQNLQKVGRGMRTADNKTELTVIDFFDNSTRWLKAHSNIRENLWRSQGFKVTVDVR